MEQPFFIGICGGSGSGKTYLLEALKKSFQQECSICSLDDYYKTKENQSLDENGIINFDLPNALDTEKLTTDLKKLKAGESITQNEYHFNVAKEANQKIINPAPIIIVEGLFVLEYKFVQELLDFSIYISVDENIQLERRLERDLYERGYSKEQILYQWNNHVLPCYDAFLKPHKEEASFKFDNNLEFKVELTRLLTDLKDQVAINA